MHPKLELPWHRMRPWIDIVLLCTIGLPLFAVHALLHPSVLLSKAAARRAFFACAFVVGSDVLDKRFAKQKAPLIASAKGVVLDIGSGRGANLKYLDPSQVTRLYLLEPNAQMHLALMKAAAAAGFPHAEILPYGIEDLEKRDFKEGTVDTVLCVLTLCSVPDPKNAPGTLHRMLKSGGRLIFFEHVGSSDAATRRYQKSLHPIWNQIADGCHLDRDTESWILEGATWSAKDVQDVEGDSLKYSFDPKRMGWVQK